MIFKTLSIKFTTGKKTGISFKISSKVFPFFVLIFPLIKFPK
ncbi:hypothetical protein A5852_000333, partial [Enterococcus faecium]